MYEKLWIHLLQFSPSCYFSTFQYKTEEYPRNFFPFKFTHARYIKYYYYQQPLYLCLVYIGYFRKWNVGDLSTRLFMVTSNYDWRTNWDWPLLGNWRSHCATETEGRWWFVRVRERFRCHGFSITKGSPRNPERRETLAKTSFEPSLREEACCRKTFSIKVVITKEKTVYIRASHRIAMTIPEYCRHNRD